MRFLRLLVVMMGLALSGSAAESGAQGEPPVAMEPYVIEASSAPAFLELGFRHHLMWAGIKTLTFKSVPAAWAKAGIKVGDRVVAIDGKVVDGMTLRGDLAPLLNAKFPPNWRKSPTPVPFKFEIESKSLSAPRTIRVILNSNNAFTIGT